jgi:hypothetical protein
MEVEVEAEPCGAFKTFLNDASKLLWFVKRYNNTLPEYIRIARMYLFGTPIRRTGAPFRRATPGYVSFRFPNCSQLAMTPTPTTQVRPAQALLEQTRKH